MSPYRPSSTLCGVGSVLLSPTTQCRPRTATNSPPKPAKPARARKDPEAAPPGLF
ncbi:hypothetical protein [Microbispora sp. H13382]|uniref:hypothetical protein n=1 Tax=Microbispora sp. H13382 TaxID=2729112 RepID=UPI001600B76A|nr:hypothetical protein [Microbispora sp. H13382]